MFNIQSNFSSWISSSFLSLVSFENIIPEKEGPNSKQLLRVKPWLWLSNWLRYLLTLWRAKESRPSLPCSLRAWGPLHWSRYSSLSGDLMINHWACSFGPWRDVLLGWVEGSGEGGHVLRLYVWDDIFGTHTQLHLY